MEALQIKVGEESVSASSGRRMRGHCSCSRMARARNDSPFDASNGRRSGRARDCDAALSISVHGAGREAAGPTGIAHAAVRGRLRGGAASLRDLPLIAGGRPLADG